jgi:hypothetical protein
MNEIYRFFFCRRAFAFCRMCWFDKQADLHEAGKIYRAIPRYKREHGVVIEVRDIGFADCWYTKENIKEGFGIEIDDIDPVYRQVDTESGLIVRGGKEDVPYWKIEAKEVTEENKSLTGRWEIIFVQKNVSPEISDFTGSLDQLVEKIEAMMKL